MGLLSIIRKQKLKDKEIRILMLGLDNAGKTTIVKRLLKQDIEQVSPTMGFEINTINHSDFNLNIWDVGGQQTIRNFWFNYFEKNDVLIYVVDGASVERMDENAREFESLMKEDHLISSKVVVLVNKMDLVADQEEMLQNVTNKLRGGNRDIVVLGVSAVGLDSGLDDVFDIIIDSCRDQFS